MLDVFSHVNVIVTRRWRTLVLVSVTQMEIALLSNGHVINGVSLLPNGGLSS